jgi:hypothetical protein
MWNSAACLEPRCKRRQNNPQPVSNRGARDGKTTRSLSRTEVQETAKQHSHEVLAASQFDKGVAVEIRISLLMLVLTVAYFVASFGPDDKPSDFVQQTVRADEISNGTRIAVDQSVVIKGVPHVRQKPDFCGEACAASWLRHLKRPVDQDYVFDQSGLSPLLARGCYTKELATSLQRIGFRTGPVWNRIKVADRQRGLGQMWDSLLADLHNGVPSIVCMHYSDQPNTTEHFRLILGYDAKTAEVIYHEPAEDNGAYRRMKKDLFIKLWPLKYSATEWTVVRMSLRHQKLAVGRASPTFTAADYAQHIRKLKKTLPHKDFTILIEAPFVVVGDESAAQVQRRAEGTVRWAVKRLKAAYFEKDPIEILDVWLFKDKASYMKHTKKLWNKDPGTPYGYYSSTDKALVMNIATGGGTLVHEIVHPFIESNFQDCPSWLNEGLGSLYEQSNSRDGKIIGMTNWRLAGLQRAISKDSVPSFKELCSTTRFEFYNKDKGTNYSQARYLCYYLQERGLLRKFYHTFHKNVAKDPTGYESLKSVLGVDDMAAFKKDWERYVVKLRF